MDTKLFRDSLESMEIAFRMTELASTIREFFSERTSLQEEKEFSQKPDP